MPTLDVFNQDAFSLMSLTAAINKAPYKPSRIGQLGLFGEQRISTTQVMVEERDGLLSLIPTTPRGGPADSIGAMPRTVRSFVVPHLARESTILADEIQNVRAFGSENELQAVQAVVDGRLATLRAMHEVTLEYHRIGAIKGLILDADGVTPIYNLFTEFGVVQQTQDFAFTTDTTDIRALCVAVARLIEAELGAAVYDGIRAFCSPEFFDALIGHPTVIDSFRYQEGQMNRADLRKGFQYGGITFEEYRGTVNGVRFVEANVAYAVPEGVMTEKGSLFQTNFAPADFMETVNTLGLPIYAKQAPDPSGLNRFVNVHSQSNPLCLCLRPRAVIQLTMS